LKAEHIASQFLASFAMLRAAVSACHDALWDRDVDDNRFWQIAYHTLFYTDLYLAPSEEAFVPWEKHIADYPHMGRLPWPPHDEPRIGEPYTKDEIVAYLALIEAKISESLAAIPDDDPSGFHWLPMTKGETHLYNLRHVQHHVGQLIERLRQETGQGVDWIKRDERATSTR